VTIKAAIVTCITDGYETLKPTLPQVDADVEWICVTDGRPFPPAEEAEGWNMVMDPALHGQHPNRAAKRPKLEPWRYTDAPSSIWIDGSYRVTSPFFATQVLAYANPIAQFPHPWRDCALDEAEFSATLAKYAGEPLMEQMRHYEKFGHPRHWGLWAAGVIARHHTPEVRYLGEVWRDQIGQWSFQDQVSQPYALRKSGLRPNSLIGDHLINPWLNYEGSARH
jgi:Protein of unknown function (DUF616)